MSLHLSKCHIVGNHMSWLICFSCKHVVSSFLKDLFVGFDSLCPSKQFFSYVGDVPVLSKD